MAMHTLVRFNTTLVERTPHSKSSSQELMIKELSMSLDKNLLTNSMVLVLNIPTHSLTQTPIEQVILIYYYFNKNENINETNFKSFCL